MKKLSIIVPVYNVYDYIDQCLNSLVNQTLEDIEIVVVNDGSPDNSQEIIDKYVEKYPSKVRSFIKENGGQSTARNYGLDYIDGEYVSFVDSDDYLDENFAKEMYEKAKEENADVVVCDMVDVYPNKVIRHDCTHFNKLYEITPSVCNKIFKKELIGNKKFKSGIWYEDLNFMLKLYPYINKVSVVEEDYYLCNCRNVSTMRNNNSKKNLDILEAIEDAKSYLIESKNYNEEIFEEIIFQHVLIETINRVEQQKNKDKKEVLKVVRKYCKENLKNYKKLSFYKNVSKNRKIIATLNYYNLSVISKNILNVKEKMK